nr:MAG TPA: hypothetical protein [Caudoviricetes sp.]
MQLRDNRLRQEACLIVFLCLAVRCNSAAAHQKKKKGGDAVQTVLLLIFGTAAIISEFAFRMHNYRLDRQLEQQGGIYDETIYRNRHFDS